MTNNIFMRAEEVQEYLGVSRTESYRIIKRLNEELKKGGYLVISGRVSRKYLEEKIYGSFEKPNQRVPDCFDFLEM